MRRHPVRQIEQHFIDIAPAPPLRRIIALDDRMLGGVKMFGRVFVRRVVTAADVTAGAQIRRCSHSLPLLRHSSQPSALGVTLWMPATCVQPFDMADSLSRLPLAAAY